LLEQLIVKLFHFPFIQSRAVVTWINHFLSANKPTSYAAFWRCWWTLFSKRTM